MAIAKQHLILILSGALLFVSPLTAEPICTYSTYKWNVNLRKAIEFQRIEKTYTQLEPREKDEQTGCTVCEQDQVTIALPGIEPFKVCRALAKPLRDTLTTLVKNGEPIEQIVGYRVGMTRGDIDGQGNRTGFSNHSFGAAIDINPDSNGLYENCIEYGEACRLIKGGPWRPGVDRHSLRAESDIVKGLKAAGFLWGGEIPGRQKDFMHFSLSGY